MEGRGERGKGRREVVGGGGDEGEGGDGRTIGRVGGRG